MRSSAILQAFNSLPGLFLTNTLLFLPMYSVPYLQICIGSNDSHFVHNLGMCFQRCRDGNATLIINIGAEGRGENSPI